MQNADLNGVLGGGSRRDMENEQRRQQPAQYFANFMLNLR